MDDKELKEYIDSVKTDMTLLVKDLRKEILKLESCIGNIKRDLRNKMDTIREFQLSCPLSKQLKRIEGEVSVVRGRVFRNNILVYIFMTGLIALAWLQMQDGHKIQPKDVLKKVQEVENKFNVLLREKK